MSTDNNLVSTELFAGERVAVAGKTGTLQLVFQNGATIVLEKVYILRYSGDLKRENPIEIRGYKSNGESTVVGFPSQSINDLNKQQRYAFGQESLVGAFFISSD